MVWDGFIRFYLFKKYHLTFANTGTTLTNKACLINGMLDAVLCSFLKAFCILVDITAKHFGEY